MYTILDIFFVLFHTSWIVFNVFGWMARRTRRANLLTLTLTLGSWFGLGLWCGWGYCPCTDWHWDVKRELGEKDLPNSYVKYYVDALTGEDWDPPFVNGLVVGVTAMALVASLHANLRGGGRISESRPMRGSPSRS